MEIRVKRIALRNTYTIGKMYINGEYFCDTLEPKTIDLNKNGIFDNGEKKEYGKSAIPYGDYTVTLDIKSPKYSDFVKYPWAKKYLGFLPRIIGVKTHDGILIHVCNLPSHTKGCILVGRNTIVGQLSNSTAMFQKLMDEYLIPASRQNEFISIRIE